MTCSARVRIEVRGALAVTFVLVRPVPPEPRPGGRRRRDPAPITVEVLDAVHEAALERLWEERRGTFDGVLLFGSWDPYGRRHEYGPSQLADVEDDLVLLRSRTGEPAARAAVDALLALVRKGRESGLALVLEPD